MWGCLSPTHATMWHMRGGWVSHAHVSGVGLPALSSTGSALLCRPDEVQGPLSKALQLVDRSAPSPTGGSRGNGGGPSCPPPHSRLERPYRLCPSQAHPRGCFPCAPVLRANSTVLPRPCAGYALLSAAAAGDGLGQVPHRLHVARGEGRRASFSHPCCHMANERGMTCSPVLTPSGPAHL